MAASDCVFSIDVEDWFHILDLNSTPAMEDWDYLPARVERNFEALLDLADEAGARTTCFFLGWVARRYPQLVRMADRRGHEVASHGYGHQLALRMSRDEFGRDVLTARRVIEDIAGRAVRGYRAPGFSATAPWFFEKLVEAGYDYDASVFPGRHGHGGSNGVPLKPYRIGALTEFPMTMTECFGVRLCLFGGGYLRLFPLALIQRAARRVRLQGRPMIFYVHPREIDPEQPRLPMPLDRHFKCYVNLGTARRKIRALLAEFGSATFSSLLETTAPSLVGAGMTADAYEH